MEKDKLEKTLASYNDVFSDIINVLIFGGKQEVREEELEDKSTDTFYTADDTIRSQVRDISKIWKRKGVVFALMGIENQTAIDTYMPFRVIGYDGASYREQALPENRGSKNYPVVTVVLYFGEQPWRTPKTLYDCMSVPEELKPFVSNYHINVFDIAHLSDEQVAMFQSDFRIVAEYFSQKNKEHEPSRVKMKHAFEILKLMTFLTRDKRYEEAYMPQMEGGTTTMCEVLDRVEKKGEENIRKLNRYLIANHRLDDLERASVDDEFCQNLLKEMASTDKHDKQ